MLPAKITGTLPVGILFAGKLHTEFELRRARVADTVEAYDEVGGDSAIRLDCTQIARQIMKLGDIPPRVKDKPELGIDPGIVIGADEADFETLQAARALLAKKPLNWPASNINEWPSQMEPKPAASISAAPSSA